MLSLTGYRANDPKGKAWTSPHRQLNQRATDYDFQKFETVAITEEPVTFHLLPHLSLRQYIHSRDPYDHSNWFNCG